MKRLCVILIILCALIFACPLPQTREMAAARLFYADDLTTGLRYELIAENMYEGEYCVVYKEMEISVDDEYIPRLAEQFDTVIYPMVIAKYGDYTAINPGGKTILLLLDIRDGYNLQGGYVAGYFSSMDMSSHYARSNKSNILYIDTDPGLKTETSFTDNLLPTLAHELQHMVNYSYHVDQGYSSGMDAWIDEGLSTSAEYLFGMTSWDNVGEKHQQSRISYFNNDTAYTIRNGNTFLIWNDPDPAVKSDIQANYSSVYLFFQWLRLHAANDDAIYKAILQSPYADYRAVVDAARLYITDMQFTGTDYFTDWNRLYSTWLAANVIYASSGIYGYKEDFLPNNRPRPNSPTKMMNGMLPLYAGEALYSWTDGSLPQLAQGNIRYIAVPQGADLPVQPADLTGPGVLITYNATPVNKPLLPLQGFTAGPIAPLVVYSSVQTADPQGRAALNPALPDTYVIDARTLLHAFHNVMSTRKVITGTVLNTGNEPFTELVIRDTKGRDWRLDAETRRKLSPWVDAEVSVEGFPEEEKRTAAGAKTAGKTKKVIRYSLKDVVVLSLPEK